MPQTKVLSSRSEFFGADDDCELRITKSRYTPDDERAPFIVWDIATIVAGRPRGSSSGPLTPARVRESIAYHRALARRLALSRQIEAILPRVIPHVTAVIAHHLDLETLTPAKKKRRTT